MKLLDKIALNRLIGILTSFVLAIIKLIVPKESGVSPKRKKIFPRIIKNDK
jgi:hypothetical protein